MTRDEAYQKFRGIDISNIKFQDFNLAYYGLLDEIFDHFEPIEEVAKQNVLDSFNGISCENCKNNGLQGCMIIEDWDCYNDEACDWIQPETFAVINGEERINK